MGLPFDPQLSMLFRALGDDTRLLILEQLKERDDQTLFELHGRVFDEHGFCLTRQAFSRHLNTLEEAGLIRTAWRGRTKVHSLTAAASFRETLAPFLTGFIKGDRP